jgi:hypothetical protein
LKIENGCLVTLKNKIVRVLYGIKELIVPED